MFNLLDTLFSFEGKKKPKNATIKVVKRQNKQVEKIKAKTND